jgi:predicted aspartyl protease
LRRFLVVSLLAGTVLCGLTAGVAYASQAHAAQAQIPIVVVKAKDGATAVLAKVIIHGRAFPFLIDTGATVSVVNPTLANKLHLKQVGKPQMICGVTGCSSSGRVRLSRWSINGTPLPKITVSTSNIGGVGAHAFGLLGSDVLSRFGSITIDYQHKVLTLG